MPRRGVLDFANEDASREVTRVLLLEDFGIRWRLPPGHLVPPVTNRANYIHWIEDLLALSSPPGEHAQGWQAGTQINN
jgi:23S rRNA (adenine1618-N6)-methyltransferase